VSEGGTEPAGGVKPGASRTGPAEPRAEDRARPGAAAMPRDQRAYVIAMCAIIGAAFAYAACEWGNWPRLTYLPLRGELTLGGGGGAIAIVYLGIVAWGASGLVCGALVGAILCRLAPRPWAERALHLFGAWAIAALLLAGGYFTWSLWPW
jgi:hypothetical protein